MIKLLFTISHLMYVLASYFYYGRITFSQIMISLYCSYFFYQIKITRHDIFRNFILLLWTTFVLDLVFFCRFLYMREFCFISVISSDFIWKLQAVFFYFQFYLALLLVCLALLVIVLIFIGFSRSYS